MSLKLDDVLRAYKEIKTVKGTAQEVGLSAYAVTKILVTQGIYPTPSAKKVARLRLMDFTDDEIMSYLRMSPKALFKYTPYTKGSYVIGEKSPNALKIAKTRAKKRAMENQPFPS